MLSSESWRESDGTAVNIVKRNRHMRSAVKHSRHSLSSHELCDRLPVYNGASSLKTNASSSGESTSVGRPLPARGKHQKRFSNDSGLSDGSYKRRRHRLHRHPGRQNIDCGQRSSTSLRVFRAACERALHHHQKQISQVMQLCERLTVQNTEREQPSSLSPVPASTDTSELSSSSTSTRDKHRTKECKTYKIITNKLDELNRLLAAGGRQSVSPRRRSRRPSSSGSVTVSDKMVGTDHEVEGPQQAGCGIARQTPQLVERAAGSGNGSICDTAIGSRERSPRVPTLNTVTEAYAFNISPSKTLQKRPNIVTESIGKEKYVGDETRSRKCEPQCGFDLDDPLHLYSQAKRLRALHVTARRRARSADGVSSSAESDDREREYKREHEQTESGSHEMSLCALCRWYWRSFRHYVAGQLFYSPR